MHFSHIFTRKFRDSDFDSLPLFHNEIKVSVLKTMKVDKADPKQVWLKLLKIRNRDLHSSPLMLTNTHGI